MGDGSPLIVRSISMITPGADSYYLLVGNQHIVYPDPLYQIYVQPYTAIQ